MNSRGWLLGVFLCCAIFGLRGAACGQADAETRVLEYLREHARPGQPLIVTDLYNSVFTKSDERAVLDKLYNAFFRIPLFLAEYQEKFGAPPKLHVIAEQFDLSSPRAADTLIRVMETDPRVPSFLTRDPQTGEIVSVDSGKIRGDARFGKAVAHHLGGWEGKPAPDFKLAGLKGEEFDSTTLKGRAVLLYVWFTGCPPCMKQTPELVTLSSEFPASQFIVLAANADRLLGLGYDDSIRRKYVETQGIPFPVVNWTRESDSAYGTVSIFPTMFLIEPNGTVAQEWVGYVESGILRRAVSEALAGVAAGR